MDVPSHIERMVIALSGAPTRNRQEGGPVVDWNAFSKMRGIGESGLLHKIPFNTKSWEYLQQRWPVSTNIEDRRNEPPLKSAEVKRLGETALYDMAGQPRFPLPQPRPESAPQSGGLDLSFLDRIPKWMAGQQMPTSQPQQQLIWGSPPAQPWPSSDGNSP